MCPRLQRYRHDSRAAHPDWFNGPVPPFGPATAALLIVGLAPGLRGANRTGRPFTGDAAGDLLYPTLLRHHLASGTYDARADDGLQLVGCRITNAVRCVPPQNKPTGGEAAACRRFLRAEIAGLPRLRAILALGRVAHGAALAALGHTQSAVPFRHGVWHDIACDVTAGSRPVRLWASYHCSRYNTNTGRLTEEMFAAVIGDIAAWLKTQPPEMPAAD
ncbi:MAG: uracil-DNA glycosylase [Alphaproteobacteria bacterium]